MDRRRVLLGLATLAAGAVWWSGQSRPATPDAPDRIDLARATGRPVLVEFGAGHCTACRERKGVLAALEARHGDRMLILDIEFATPEGRRVLQDYGMQAIPTQLFFAADGTEIGRHIGAIPADDILTTLGLNDG